MLNKNEYLLDEILKTVDRIVNDKFDDVVLNAIEEHIAANKETNENIKDLQDGIADVKIEMAEIKTMLQQIIDIVLKQTVDIGKDFDNDIVNRARKILGAYGDHTDEME